MKILILLILMSSFSYGKEIVFGREKIFIGIKYDLNQHTKKSNWSLLRFPIEVKTMDGFTKFEIKPYNEQNPDYSEVKIRPLFNNISQSGRVILADDTILRIKIDVGSSIPNDFYVFKPLIPYKSTTGSFGNVKGLDFLRSVSEGRVYTGHKRESVNKRIRCSSSNITFRLTDIIRSPKFKGYRFKAKNSSVFNTIEFKPENIKVKRISKNESFYFLANDYEIRPGGVTDVVLVLPQDLALSNVDLCSRQSKFMNLLSRRIKL